MKENKRPSFFSGLVNDYNFVVARSSTGVYFVGQYKSNYGDKLKLSNYRIIASLDRLSISELITKGRGPSGSVFLSEVRDKTTVDVDMIASASQAAIESLYGDLGDFEKIKKKLGINDIICKKESSSISFVQ